MALTKVTAAMRTLGNLEVDTAHLAADAVDGSKISVTSEAQGDLMWHDGTNWARVAKGTAGQILQGNTTSIPTWVTAGPSQATQAAVEAETNENTYVPPDFIKYNPGVAKGWADIDQTGTMTLDASYNVTSITDDGTGTTTITIANDMSSANYPVLGSEGAGHGSGSHTIGLHVNTRAVGSFQIECKNFTTAVDRDPVSVVFFGDL